MNKILNDKLYGKIIKTFLEGFLSALIVSLNTIHDFSNLDLLKSVIVGALAMGISAVINLFQEYLNGKSNIKY